MSTNEDLIGRSEINDLEAILSVSAPDQADAIRFVKDKQGDEAAHQWGRVFFTPLIEDEEEVYASPRKHRPAIVKDKAAKAAA